MCRERESLRLFSDQQQRWAREGEGEVEMYMLIQADTGHDGRMAAFPWPCRSRMLIRDPIEGIQLSD